MPPPAAYITITNPPLWITTGPGFDYQIQVADFNAGTYGNVANEIWFRYDTGADPEAFGWWNGTSTGFTPATNLYESDGSTLINGNTGDNGLWWPLANNSTYFVRIRRQGGGAMSVPTMARFEGAPIGLGTIPDGSWVINDDSDEGDPGNTGFPSAVFDPDGEFIGFIAGIPAGETGDALPTGESLWHDRFGMYSPGGFGLALFDANFNFIDDVILVPALADLMPKICNDGTDFYVVDDGNIWRVIAATGAFTLLDTFSPVAGTVQAAGVTRDGTKIFWAEGYESDSIRQHVIGGASSIFYTIPGFIAGDDYIALTAINNHPGEILVLQDGTICTIWHDFSLGKGHILHLSDAGVLLNDIEFDDVADGELDHLHYSPNGAGFVHAWFFTNGDNEGKFGEVSFATETFSLLFEKDLLSVGENKVPGSGQIFGPSASCVMVTFKYPGTETPPIDAEITVIKQIVGGIEGDNEIEFQLVATGMDPINFTLRNGESITFSGLPNGTYGVVEVGEPGFITTYTVSNGDNHNTITVTAGDSVTVTVTNTRTTYGGIYKIQPSKRNDTLWTDVIANETQEVKIPNPKIRSALLGQ